MDIPGKIKNTYLYDADHRLKETKNFMYTPTRVEDNYSSHYEYDKAGNIQHLTRYGFTGLDASHDPTYGIIDRLTYTYDLDFYLTGVTNDLNAASDEYGFKGGGSGYDYDLKGNMIESTLNDMIIQYNPLNLPGVISFNSASDIQTTHYSANGTKIMTVDQYTNPPIGHPSDLTRVYLMGMELEYEGAGDFSSTFTPKAYNFGDGQVLFDDTELRYRYYLHDHLGNVVVVFEDKNGDGDLEETTDLSTNEVPHRHHYYSFGMQWDLAQSASALPPLYSDDNRYQYNGKEYKTIAQLLDYGWRWYDPVIGRWNGVDPHAENYFQASPYAYVENNPIIRIDPDGRDWYRHDETGAVKWREGSKAIDGYSNNGTHFTMDLGSGLSLTYNQNTPETLVETVLNPGDWETQRELIYDRDGNISGSKNKSGDEGNCFYQAGQMVSNSGATSLGGTANNINTSDGQANYMNGQIGIGNSVRLHVDYNGDGVGDHWVAISSRTTNLTNNTSTYNFYDPGTVWQASGTHNTNTFNVNNGTLSGTTFYNGRTYTVIAVRRNQ